MGMNEVYRTILHTNNSTGNINVIYRIVSHICSSWATFGLQQNINENIFFFFNFRNVLAPTLLPSKANKKNILILLEKQFAELMLGFEIISFNAGC
jgi:hypothetical protein